MDLINFVCKICNLSFSIDSMSCRKNKCKACYKIENKKYNDLKKEYRTNYYIENKEKIQKRKFNNKDSNSKYNKNYREKNKSELLEYAKKYNKKYYELNSEKIKVQCNKYYHFNSEKCNKQMSLYKSKNKEKRNKRDRERKINNPFVKVSYNLRTRLNQIISQKRFNKNNNFAKYIGCSLEELKYHLEKQFAEGMTWDNYGKWHIDHIIPLSAAKTEIEIYELCHYTNLQPLWAKDNLKKGARLKAP